MTAGNAAGADDDIRAVRRWVRLSRTEPGTHLPVPAEIAADLRLSRDTVRAALERLAAEGTVTLYEGYRPYSVGTTTPTERAYRLLRTAIHRSYEPGERFMTRYDIGQRFDIGGKEAAAAVRQPIAEALLTGPRGRYVNAFSLQQQCRQVKQLRERAGRLRREALELMRTAWERSSRNSPPEATPSRRDRPRSSATRQASRCEPRGCCSGIVRVGCNPGAAKTGATGFASLAPVPMPIPAGGRPIEPRRAGVAPTRPGSNGLVPSTCHPGR
ncbi:GntR family transcriptional regulator [Streptomyces sp. NPDC059913]|uniref:GntR family transcriptional regulator n=1 Tax=unclassified Streptomyces TaxID=2593676 RepID=UPI0036602738